LIDLSSLYLQIYFNDDSGHFRYNKLSEYFNNSTLSDMKLIVKNSGYSFQLHKVILYSRSEFFRKLIEINPHEKVYEIDDNKLNLKLFTSLVFVLSFSNEMKFTLKHTKHNQQMFH
jgi:hypothetical protein